MPFLASAGFRWPPVCQCKGSGTANQSSNAEFPRNIRILGAIMSFLPSVRFRGLPVCPCKGRVRQTKVLTLNFHEIFAPRGLRPFLASVSFRGLPACPCKGSGTVTQSPNAEIPGNIRILGGLGYF